VDDEQNTEGVTCLSVAVPGGGGPPAAVSATLLTARLTDGLLADLVADLTALARELSRTASL
jgi:DNA-binding IclR family transcriptional regulator